MKENNNKSKSFLSLLFSKLFGIGGKKDPNSILKEAQVQSPLRTVVKNFVGNKISMTGLVIFLCIFIFVLVAPNFYKLDLSYQESTQANIAPGKDMLSVPKALQGNIADIAVGPSFSIGLSKDGKLYPWGKTKITSSIDIKNIPEIEGKVVDIAVGIDHVVALTEEGDVTGWGNSRLKQLAIPKDIKTKGNIIQLEAGYQISAAVTDQGYVFSWGNTSVNDAKVRKKLQGTIQKVAFTSNTMIGLTKNGEVVYMGNQETAISKIPEAAKSGVVDIATTAQTCAAVKEDGSIIVWGNISKGENVIPEFDSPVIAIQGGRYHYTVLTENGTIYSWGANDLKQSKIPKKLASEQISDIKVGYYQNYAFTEDGRVIPFGHKGYLLGTDELGRDILTRLVNGGKMTMTIGAISVIISTIIGVIVGGISGYFGGKVDIILQRITEMVSSMPFLPFAMILSSIVGNSMTENQRISLIMVVLGVLSWPGLCRLVRAQVLSEREQEFVTAARAMGVKQLVIVFKHIIPNVISVIIVSATLDFASCMIIESTLSYLGFGVSLPRPTWGNMLSGSNNSVVIQNYWWRWVFPSLALGICVICINLIGDGLRDAIDPKSNER